MSKKTVTKRILREGKWFHPQAPKGVLNITKDYLQRLKSNFERSPYVPIYRGHVKNEEAERNTNLILSKNVKNVELKGDGLYATYEIPEEAEEKYNDLSAGIEDNSVDAETGELIGPVLQHIAYTVNPYIKKLNPLTLSEDSKPKYLIYLSEIQPMDEDKKLKSEEEKAEETKVKEAEEETPEADTTEEESKADTSEDKKDESKSEDEADKSTEDETSEEDDKESESDEDKSEEDELEESEDEDKSEIIENSDKGGKSYEDLQKEVIQLSQTVAMQSRELNKKSAEAKYNELLKAGKIAPTMKDAFIELSCQSDQLITLSDGKKTKSVSALVHEIFDNMPQLVQLSESGYNPEQGDIASKIQLSGSFLKELRSLHPDKSDKEFSEFVEANKETLTKYNKSKK